MKNSVNTAVVGMAWGDEGKGKVTDEASENAEYVVRAEGGSNAGHTIKVGDTKFVGHLIPSGVVAGAKCLLGRGVRIELDQFFAELDDLTKLGIKPQVWIDDGAFLIFQWHKVLELWSELAKGSRRAYTTMRGMCSTAAAIGLRVNPKISMLLRSAELEKWLVDFYKVFEPVFTSSELLNNPSFQTMFGAVLTPEQALENLLSFSSRIYPYLIDVRHALFQAWMAKQPIVFEGAQGLLLDPYWSPTYGFNTQGICTFAGLAQGTGLPMEALGTKYGVFKATYSRVGNGGFPSELGNDKLSNVEKRIPDDQKIAWLSAMLDKINKGHATDQEIGQYFRVIGAEYGATTGRPRRIGWLNLAELAYSVQINWPDRLAFTKMDCLSGLKKVKVCVGHKMPNGQELLLGQMPELASDFSELVPVLREMDGWSENITGETSFEKLPKNAQEYVLAIEKFLGKPITIIGTGPDREHVIKRVPA
ncbi:MAG: hypothetical protein A2301_02435 [Candidatus Magasanikbacteria bacterium RIFOXYB2_FULL_40_13]|nr:MAG: hypothetical protein A2224_00130 [Candidatus Magasanikbacteria bacterium RIFOXYA2_FULL_40_20]OGH86545.1 MAG: hypothetical protein A2301_02435 [Candidatus Magasanikbacteria bacterium RIFOXYB2_FULL_40_13]